MENNENTVNFDLSTLSLGELVTLYERVDSFLVFLGTQKKEEEAKEEEKNE